MDLGEALSEIEALKAGLDETCDALMVQVERGFLLANEQPHDVDGLKGVLAEIMTLCSFQDLAGQRLTRLSNAITGGSTDLRPDADLLHGPANAGGLDQAAADALFDGR